MTAEPDLLPSSVAAFTEALKGERGSLDAWLEVNDEREVAAHVEAYARACVSSATEALRAEVAEWKRVAAAQAELHGEAEARAERLAEALLHLRNHTSVNSHQIELIDTALHPTAAQEEGRE